LKYWFSCREIEERKTTFFARGSIVFEKRASLLFCSVSSVLVVLFQLKNLHSWELVFVNRNCGMIVKSLSCQHLGQITLASRRLLQLCSLVLEPDLDLGFVQAELCGKTLSPLFRQISVVVEFFSESAKLFG